MRRFVAFANRAQDQADASEFQHRPNTSNQGQRQINDDVMLEEHPANKHDIPKRAEIDVTGGRRPELQVIGTKQARQTQPEQRQR